MVTVLLLFVVVAAISFVGSLQPGPVNMRVLAVSLEHGKSAGTLTAFGGCLPELLYSYLALAATGWVTRVASIAIYVDWFIIIFFTVLGIITFTKKPVQPQEQAARKNAYFLQGLLLGLFNPLLFSYWLMISLLMTKYGYDLNAPGPKGAFIIGTAVGGLSFLLMTVQLGLKIRSLLGNVKQINSLLGLIYIGVAAAQLIKLLIK